MSQKKDASHAFDQLPQGLSIPLMRNQKAMSYFNGLSPQEQNHIAAYVRSGENRNEIRARAQKAVQSLAMGDCHFC